MIDRKVMFLVGDKFIELLVYFGIVGFDVIDVWGLVQEGVFIYDLGFVFIVVCELVIIYIDGVNGVFLYCGYLIE